MLFLGIVFVALAAGATVGIIADNANNTANVTLSTLGPSFHGLSVADTFLLGAAVACVFLVGCALVTSAVRRTARVRRELRELRNQHDENVQVLMAEKAQLERELARERRRVGGVPGSRPDTTMTGQGGDMMFSRAAPSIQLAPGEFTAR